MKTAPYAATWFHPDFAELGALDGEVRFDNYHQADVFFPSKECVKQILGTYGTDSFLNLVATNGLLIGGKATVTAK